MGHDRPKVLYVVLATEYSGAETAQAPVLTADPDPLLACPRDSATETWARRLGVATVPLQPRAVRVSAGRLETLRSAVRALLVARELRGVLRDHPERTVVVGTSARPAAVASVAALGLTGRRVVWVLTDLLPGGPLGPALLALARLTRASLVCHSRWMAERVSRRAVVCRPGVPAPPLPAARRDPARAAVVGHISPTKRTDLAVDVAVLVGARRPEFRLEVIGRAQYRKEDRILEAALRERLERDALAARHVELVGHETDVAGRLARCSVMLHCRPDEPFGMVLVEAMAAGLAVVAPAAAGPLEIVVDGVTGFLYPPGDARAAADCVVRLVADPALARRMGDAGRERALDDFPPERHVAEMDAVIRGAQPAPAATSA